MNSESKTNEEQRVEYPIPEGCKGCLHYRGVVDGCRVCNAENGKIQAYQLVKLHGACSHTTEETAEKAMMRFAAGDVSDEWFRVYAASRSSEMAYLQASYRMLAEGNPKPVRLITIPRWQYERFLDNRRNGIPYYIIIGETPLTIDEIEEISQKPSTFAFDFHEGL